MLKLEGYARLRGMRSGRGNIPARHGALRILFAFIITLGLGLASFNPIAADDSPRDYEEEVIVHITHWQLARWQDGATVCNLYLRHETLPNLEEVTQNCGQETAKTWLSTPPCQDALNGGSGASCNGLLLRQVGKSSYSYTRNVNLPPITMRVVITNCTPGEWCKTRPEVRLVAQEPLSDQKITRVHIRIGSREIIYDGADALIRLPLTGELGDTISYWAESSFGDESEVFSVKFRAYKSDSDIPYRFDLLNSDWASNLPGGALLWSMFPPVDQSLPELFNQPLSAGYLATTNRYAYLAGNLILAGKVDASECRDGGVNPEGFATACGEKVSAQQVLEWQNRYDQKIYLAALKYNIPARILKGVIAQESQFWPVSSDPYERGLGYITENGVSMLLLWNTEYFLSLCLPIYGENTCSAGYAGLREDRQTVVRRAAFDKVGTSEEIDLLAAMLYASARQTRQMVYNVARTEPANISTFENMWKMSVANYYSGSGCLGTALTAALKDSKAFVWDDVSAYMPNQCQNSIDYVERVFFYSE